MEREERSRLDMSFWEKYALTVNEACAYFHIGEKKFREILEDYPDAGFVLMSGKRVMIKKRRFENFLDQQLAI